MRSFTQINNEMDNDPSSARNYDRDPMEDLSVDEMEEYFENSDFNNQEFSVLNNQLDQLQSALDVLESRNADIHQELLQLLQSNREVRRVMEEEMQSENEAANLTDIPVVKLDEDADDKVTSSTTQLPTDQSADESTPVATIVTTATTEINLVQSIDAIKLEKISN